MKITAELKEKLDIQTFGEAEKEFKKQTLIFAETEPEVEYPNTIAIDFFGDNLQLAGAMDIGKHYIVNFSISCKKAEKWGVFNTIKGRKVKPIETNVETISDWSDIPF